MPNIHSLIDLDELRKAAVLAIQDARQRKEQAEARRIENLQACIKAASQRRA